MNRHGLHVPPPLWKPPPRPRPRPRLWATIGTLPGDLPVIVTEARYEIDGERVRGYLITLNERATQGAVERHHIRHTTGEPADLLWEAMEAGDPRTDPDAYDPWWDPEYPVNFEIIDDLVERGRLTPWPDGHSGW